MREKLSCNLLHGIYCGITPASAGKTFFYHVAMVDVQYRPHVCGKNISDILKMVRVLGSPPRMREKLNLKRFIRLNERITPAYAGKTWRNWTYNLKVWDHPRMCGKNLLVSFLLSSIVGSPPHVREKRELARNVVILGSPPRMREKLIPWLMRPVLTRITPAYAGKTRTWSWDDKLSRDHPRVCGKNNKMLSSLFAE